MCSLSSEREKKMTELCMRSMNNAYESYKHKESEMSSQPFCNTSSNSHYWFKSTHSVVRSVSYDYITLTNSRSVSTASDGVEDRRAVQGTVIASCTRKREEVIEYTNWWFTCHINRNKKDANCRYAGPTRTVLRMLRCDVIYVRIWVFFLLSYFESK